MENSAQLQAGERARGCSVPQAGPEPAAGAARGGAGQRAQRGSFGPATRNFTETTTRSGNDKGNNTNLLNLLEEEAISINI